MLFLHHRDILASTVGAMDGGGVAPTSQGGAADLVNEWGNVSIMQTTRLTLHITLAERTPRVANPTLPFKHSRSRIPCYGKWTSLCAAVSSFT